MRKVLLAIIVLLIIIISAFFLQQQTKQLAKTIQKTQIVKQYSSPLMIEAERQKKYPGSEIQIEEELANEENYKQYVASYKSDGLKIFALLTIPTTEMPKNGYPVIIFNHGYIPPEQYRTTERYVAYVNGFARSGYIVFKPDYRGHGSSEGQPEGAYYSPAYTTDVLNAVSSIKKLREANPNKIGMWGHSMGGNITMRAMVVSKDIKAGVIWSGVVGTYDDLINRWVRSVPFQPSLREVQGHVNSIRKQLIDKYGPPSGNHPFWNSIDPHFYLKDISGPIQLHHETLDNEVPEIFSQSLYNDLKKAGKSVELYTYEGTDHNMGSPVFEVAMQRSVNFFDKYLKN